jgi:hypothetical protein
MNEHAVARTMFCEMTGYVYFVQMDRIGPIKIGFSRDIGKRLVSLQTSNAYPLRLLCCYPSNESHEKEWHSAFHNMRLEGEWFLPHPKLLREIDGQIQINNRNGQGAIDNRPYKEAEILLVEA